MIHFRALDQADLPFLEDSFKDEWLQKVMAGFFPIEKQVHFILSQPTYFAYVIQDEEQKIGYIEWEEEEGNAYLALFLRSEMRHKGYGKRILQHLETLPELKRVNKIVALVATFNRSAQLFFEDSGYKRIEKEDEFWRFERETG